MANQTISSVQVPQWSHHLDNPTAQMILPHLPVSGISSSSSTTSCSLSEALLTALNRYKQLNGTDANTTTDITGGGYHVSGEDYFCDEFRMYDFKVRRCTRVDQHEWVDCPYVHPEEKARRRDPVRYNYSATGCTEFRKGSCKKGDACEYAHGVFESWLHPDRYRTQACKDGIDCRRKICFFAHTVEQLRVGSTQKNSPLLTESPRSSYDGSPIRSTLESYFMKAAAAAAAASPTSTLMMHPSQSAPMSPMSPVAGYCSPFRESPRRSLFNNLPLTPTRSVGRSSDFWDLDSYNSFEEEQMMQRVESGRKVRENLLAKLIHENSFKRVDSSNPTPDVGWVSDLVK
ncbi:hypothetical protein MKW94_025099 [Papaver nudicaule]|uniref:C3H1-type domain-containing protein n=1 Tax=Papaver nudicaule TaxID=74823 RepID=A0AA41UZX5_PAPNU|nr:hypothetical protein [Papaver nudicaule]